MKDGLLFENGELIYYKHGKPYHAGVVKADDKIYYIGKGGRAVTGRHVIHREMTNGILKRGTYTFAEDYTLVEGSFVAPRHSSRSHGRRNKAQRNKSKKTARILWSLGAVTMALVVLLVYIAVDNWHPSPDNITADPDVQNTTIMLPMFDEEVLLCSEDAKRHYDGEITIETAIKSGEPYRPFVFDYNLAGQSGRLFLSESPDYSNAKEYELAAGSQSLTIDNLKTGTAYYYKVETEGETYTGEFQTAKSTRFISMDGAYNTRDIGGYTTLDGKTVKQGLIIRGTEIDGLVNSTYFLASSAQEYVKEEFGFVYDMDLRNEGLFTGKYTSRLGDDVKHRFFSAPAYGPAFSIQYKQSIKDMFMTLADANNYPIYLHCTHGADRTGTLIFLLQGLLNVSEEDMMDEYRLTSYFYPSYATIDYMDVVLAGLQVYEGDTLQEKIEDFLVNDVTVPKEAVERIRSMLLEE